MGFALPLGNGLIVRKVMKQQKIVGYKIKCKDPNVC
jgi:hypothetical protein